MNRHKKSRILDRAFHLFGMVSTFFGLAILAIFILDILGKGLSRINWEFLTSLPSRFPEKAGILTAWTGTLWILVLTTLIAIPIGIGAGIYLEEYARKTRLASILDINISNLAGVPSVIYGILGLELFGRFLGMGTSLLAGSFTLALLILPIVVVATREALRAIPDYIRDAAIALGATKWQTIRQQILPASGGSIITGIILALARAIGETAPLIVVGALAYVPFVARSPMDDFTVLPIQIFNWTSRPQHGFILNASGAIIILLLIVFLMNALAIIVRNRARKKVQW